TSSQFGAGFSGSGRDGIPCRIEVDFSYRGQGPGQGASESGSLHGSTKAVLFPNIKGTGAWNPANFGANAAGSTFRFEPDAPGGVPDGSGDGQGESTVHTIADTVTTKVRITRAFFGVMFVTT